MDTTTLRQRDRLLIGLFNGIAGVAIGGCVLLVLAYLDVPVDIPRGLACFGVAFAAIGYVAGPVAGDFLGTCVRWMLALSGAPTNDDGDIPLFWWLACLLALIAGSYVACL